MSQFESLGITGFWSSPQTDQLDEALAKAQVEIDAAEKDGMNPHFKSSYATLASTFTAAKPLAKHGIAVSQWPRDAGDGKAHMLTRLSYKGQWMMVDTSVPVSKNDAQGWGSAFSYLKRYGLQAAAGIPAEDDDGNAASNLKSAGNGHAKPAQETVSNGMQDKAKDFQQVLSECGWTRAEATHLARSRYNKDRISALANAEYQWIVAHVKSHPRTEPIDEGSEAAAAFADGAAHH